jgi:hypothetical protein
MQYGRLRCGDIAAQNESMLRAPTLALLAFISLTLAASAQIGGTGWKSVGLNFKIQSPTNVPQNQRYWFSNNVYHCLVYSNDGAFQVGNTTLPRTEQRYQPDYTNGEIQYQATLMASPNENSYCVFQIHTGDAQSKSNGATTFMVFWFTNNGGSVHDYSGTTLATNLANKWFQLNVDHNLVTQTIRVWVNQIPVWAQQDNSAGDFYMKDGVYEQGHGPTLQMDTYLTNILVWTSSGTNPPAGPTGLTASPMNDQIQLVWNSSVAATSYIVKRSTTDGGPYATIITTVSTNYVDNTAASGPDYYYVVSAVDSFGESTNSSQASATLFTPHPEITSTVNQGGSVILSGSGGLSNSIYYVLSSTNVTLPPQQWTPIATNFFDNDGDFTFTNVLDPNAPQLFYLLQTP